MNFVELIFAWIHHDLILLENLKNKFSQKFLHKASSKVQKILRKEKNLSYLPFYTRKSATDVRTFFWKFSIPTKWMIPYCNHLVGNFLPICTPISASLIVFLSSAIFLSFFSLILTLSRPNGRPMSSGKSSISSLRISK